MGIETATETKTTSWTTVTLSEDNSYVLADQDTSYLQEYVAVLEKTIETLEIAEAPSEIILQQKRGLSAYERALDIQEERYHHAMNEKEYFDKITKLTVELISRFPDDIKSLMKTTQYGIDYNGSVCIHITNSDEWGNRSGDARLKAEVNPWDFGLGDNDYYKTGRYMETKKTGYFGDKVIEKTLEYMELADTRSRRAERDATSKTESLKVLVDMGLAPLADYYDYFQIYGKKEHDDRKHEVGIKIHAYESGTDFTMRLSHLSHEEVDGLMIYLADNVVDFKAKALQES